MRTTVTLDDELVEYLSKELGIKKTSALIERALLEMKRQIAADRLARLGGKFPDMNPPPRRRPPDFASSR